MVSISIIFRIPSDPMTFFLQSGLELALYFMIMKKLCKKEAIGNTRMRRFLAVFSTIGLVLFTIDIACNAVWGEIMWINGRELPNGVPEFFETMVYVWYQTLGSTSVVTMIFLGDGLLVCRPYFKSRTDADR